MMTPTGTDISETTEKLKRLVDGDLFISELGGHILFISKVFWHWMKYGY